VRILVTGGAGFIGSHVVRHFCRSGDTVVCLDDLSTGDTQNLDEVDVTLVRGSILDDRALDESCHGADAIVHLAARPSVPRSIDDPAASHEANATGTLRVLQAARRAGDPLVIVASSSSVYGNNPTLPKHEGLPVRPLSPYAVSKLASEQYAIAWHHSYGMRTLALRFFNVFGPRQTPDHDYAAVIPSFVAEALRDEPLTIHGDGTQTRDFTYATTVAKIIGEAVGRSVVHDQPVNLAFGTRTSLLEVIHLLEEILGRPVARKHVASRSGDVQHSQADNSVLRTLFPNVHPVPLRTGLRETIEWMDDYLSSAKTRL
jgi:UDP-glucose 4-epimerase